MRTSKIRKGHVEIKILKNPAKGFYHVYLFFIFKNIFEFCEFAQFTDCANLQNGATLYMLSIIIFFVNVPFL